MSLSELVLAVLRRLKGSSGGQGADVEMQTFVEWGMHDMHTGSASQQLHAAANSGHDSWRLPCSPSSGQLHVTHDSDELLAALCMDFMRFCLDGAAAPACPQPDGCTPRPRYLVQVVAECSDGVLPCRLLNLLFPDTIDERVLNLPSASQPAAAAPPAPSASSTPVDSQTPQQHPTNSMGGVECSSGSSSTASSRSCSTRQSLSEDSGFFRRPDTHGGCSSPRDGSGGAPGSSSGGVSDGSGRLSSQEAAENLVLLCASAQAVGCHLQGVEIKALVEGQASALLALLADIVHTGVLQQLAADPAAAAAAAAAECRAARLGGGRLGGDVEGLDVDDDGGAGEAAADPRGWLMAWMHRCLATGPESSACSPKREADVVVAGAAAGRGSAAAEAEAPTLAQLAALTKRLLDGVHGREQSEEESCASTSAAAAASAPAPPCHDPDGMCGGERREVELGELGAAGVPSGALGVSAAGVRALLRELESAAAAAVDGGPAAAAPPEGSDRSDGGDDGGFRLATPHLEIRHPRALMLGLASALRAAQGLPLWSRGDSRQLQQGQGESPAPVDRDMPGGVGVGTPRYRPAEPEGASWNDPDGAAACEAASAPAGPAALCQEQVAVAVAEPGTSGRCLAATASLPPARPAGAASGAWRPAAGGGLDGGERAVLLRSCASTPRPGPAKPLSFGSHLHDAVVDPCEERLLRMWLNSLDHRVGLASLFSKRMRTGWPLLLAVDAIQPGSVAWGSVFPATTSRDKAHKIKNVCNCNQAVELCRTALSLPLVNIGGIDVAEGNQMAILSLVWQMMRHHLKQQLLLAAPGAAASVLSLPRLGSLGSRGPRLSSDGGRFDEAAVGPGCEPAAVLSGRSSGSFGGGQGGGSSGGRRRHSGGGGPQQQQQQQIEVLVLRWANRRLHGAESASDGGSRWTGHGGRCLRGLEDARLADGQVLLQLLSSISPGSVNPAHVLPGASAAEREQNAKYLLSLARKLGCPLFLAPRDLLEPSAAGRLILLASLMTLDSKLHGGCF